MNPTPETVEKYFNCVKGCQVSMLNGKFCGGADPEVFAVVLADVPDISSECEGNHVPNEAEIQNAISKVNDGHFAVSAPPRGTPTRCENSGRTSRVRARPR